MRVVSLGDLALDVVVRMRGPLARGADTAADVTLSAGGQGANVAAWAAALGAEARWLGKRAADGAGRLAADELERRGVELVGQQLGIGDADVNLQTVVLAARVERGYGPSLRSRSSNSR